MRRVLAALLVSASALPASPAAADPGVRCTVTPIHRACSYTATERGFFQAYRISGWEIKIYRIGADGGEHLVWQAGASSPDIGVIPSEPGDSVRIKFFSADCYIPFTAVKVPCEGGVLVASEGHRTFNPPI